MEPHFLLLGALGEDIIHQALSRVERFPVHPASRALSHSAWLSLTLIPLSDPLPVTSCHFTYNRSRWKIEIQNQRWLPYVCAFMQGEESRGKRETTGLKTPLKLPQEGHHLVCVGEQPSRSSFFSSRWEENRISYCFFFIHIQFGSLNVTAWAE